MGCCERRSVFCSLDSHIIIIFKYAKKTTNASASVDLTTTCDSIIRYSKPYAHSRLVITVNTTGTKCAFNVLRDCTGSLQSNSASFVFTCNPSGISVGSFNPFTIRLILVAGIGQSSPSFHCTDQTACVSGTGGDTADTLAAASVCRE